METFDIILLCLFIPALVTGILKGFVSQAVTLASILAGGYLAYRFSSEVSLWLGERLVMDGRVLYILSFAIIVVLFALALNLLGKLVTKLLDSLSIGWIDKLLGVLLGFLNTALILGLLFRAFASLNDSLFHIDASFMDRSGLYAGIQKICDTILPYIKDIFNGIKL